MVDLFFYRDPETEKDEKSDEPLTFEDHPRLTDATPHSDVGENWPEATSNWDPAAQGEWGAASNPADWTGTEGSAPANSTWEQAAAAPNWDPVPSA